MGKLFTSIHLKAKDNSLFLDMSWSGEATLSSKYLTLDSNEKSDIEAIRTLIIEGFLFSKTFITPVRVIVSVEIENYKVSIEN